MYRLTHFSAETILWLAPLGSSWGARSFGFGRGTIIKEGVTLHNGAGSFFSVNVIAPILTETPMTAGMMADKELFEAFVRRIPLRRIAQPEDLAAACIYLASDASDFVTGHTLVVDGGWTLHQEPA